MSVLLTILLRIAAEANGLLRRVAHRGRRPSLLERTFELQENPLEPHGYEDRRWPQRTEEATERQGTREEAEATEEGRRADVLLSVQRSPFDLLHSGTRNILLKALIKQTSEAGRRSDQTRGSYSSSTGPFYVRLGQSHVKRTSEDGILSSWGGPERCHPKKSLSNWNSVPIVSHLESTFKEQEWQCGCCSARIVDEPEGIVAHMRDHQETAAVLHSFIVEFMTRENGRRGGFHQLHRVMHGLTRQHGLSCPSDVARAYLERTVEAQREKEREAAAERAATENELRQRQRALEERLEALAAERNERVDRERTAAVREEELNARHQVFVASALVRPTPLNVGVLNRTNRKRKRTRCSAPAPARIGDILGRLGIDLDWDAATFPNASRGRQHPISPIFWTIVEVPKAVAEKIGRAVAEHLDSFNQLEYGNNVEQYVIVELHDTKESRTRDAFLHAAASNFRMMYRHDRNCSVTVCHKHLLVTRDGSVLERLSVKDIKDKFAANFDAIMRSIHPTQRSGVSILALYAQIGLYEEERVKLYQQLDEKNDEIQKVSQELEKLRQQVLLQEEALQTMLENEEIIREENSRIQKEADDKQQEGKEMMTKKSRNFPLLMQAVTATFRSTCTGVSILALHAQIGLYEEERVKLYQKLDEKDDEIQKVSQELEKLRQQVLLQEEALQTMLENEETIREENSRIQKEADDKQQEGKEMMTKKSRNFPLLMQAVTATFRSTCTGVSILALHAQIGLYEEERVKLYQKLDEKNDEIQKVSQELEKLRQQVLLQEEALQTMLENEGDHPRRELAHSERGRRQAAGGQGDDDEEVKKLPTLDASSDCHFSKCQSLGSDRTCTGVSILALHAQIGLYEEERVKLYQQLDEKNDEIQKVSQELEKLRQQVLLQEEALQTMLENEETIREENSRIQKEADDKQQEGKEMMTKKSRNFPLLMQAVTATFRSTCTGVSILALYAQIGLYEEERVKLYQKLDEKDDEIQKVSQELEKLRQQVLLQEEALQTMLENEETIREENSRIQKEADDKQQEGKEMMTKKSRNFPLLMQAVTATFRSTCTGVSILALYAQIGLYEEERVKLYQKLDEKDDEIQKVSQELEKLRQQVLLQEEALQTMLENEEIIREENSRIQKEADDKQQEGKEMMTKKSRNFPLLMQAVTATFRSTCTGVSILALYAQIGLYEEERVKLYQKLDEKNDEIQKVSQELEKLRQQVLLQEEALQTMLENEETIREENSRIQKEADDKQQEGKEMMTKKSRNFPLLMQAVTATFRSKLDEKNDEIQKVSQELEKLRQQVLLQEEALQTMLENEETIREENSRIQKEADDKQQEGKEMMTKKSRNFPLLMQAVTATFRSTCTGVSILALYAQIGLYEEERVKLYQKLDEKNDEIQKVSQELEKLRQQVLLQEEALQTMLENEGDHPRRELAHSERGRRQAAGGQGDDDEEVKKLPTLDASSDCHFSKCQSLGSDRTCTGVSILALYAQIGLYEEERVKLYQKLDEKDDEIQKVSQELEKLRQQVLLQEEALQTMLENEEIIREENSRIQKEADDKQQEGKEMMTKKSRNFPLLMQAVTATFRSTCTGVSILALYAQIGRYEEERVKLYQKLDEKNDEIQKVSQELEKLRQQVLLQEEALQTMLENEETIREENSRIQKEADDKQQEGKEMMTKKSRNFPLLMQAVTATFRSTCTGVSILALHAQIGLYEEERVKLYQKLDEKNDEIQKVSQELEKLRQQVLLQEEALQTMLENEETIREENSRIQKEADDKQQEGKEMMTKKSRNFPLLMQAVTATFRSTCTGVSILALHAQIGLYEEERVKLYQKLDEKNDEIQKVSQELEKLRQQVLLQEEALQTMLENEETIREENSRIQKEADDKQQEGKEMMTKKSRNFPLLMQAVTATFRSKLDEKDDEIQKVSQELEKLRQQVLLQEEALQTMLENEEIIREENSRIQKEADDKQQEGKEMMTKKSRNFPLLMQAVTATFRSTCTGVSILALYAQIGLYEEERVKLYQKLDEKNDEIQKVSQELEKLRQQVLLQEEALQTMLENEEIIREENSRIQKEADDKQQEGKEMMTKKSRNFPLLMQAVTATFRSTCTGVSILALHAQIGLYEEERVKLYQKLDEKNDEIQKVSQELEKLRQQVLLQEEALQTMLENEEIIREENSRIQKEADDKQQEGKEMMTKKSRNFPLLMQAVTATFRSTCTGVSILALHAQIGLYEEERVKLYQKLDEKNDEIQKVSQELEKLRQQVLLQEEALQTMLENEEIIREENSRIQKEADDKQQEGKEMMTKKSRNFPLLMQAVTATFRSTCTGVSILALYAQIGLYEEERVKLYQQLDEKNDEIQKVSQELEKLRQQVLLQEEALQTMLENEEIIREENSRIQKEADDKQQEGKEMMTKKSRNFPLLMQAVTATFRSTCTGVSILALHAQIGLYEEERVKLYQKLDEKDDEIQKVSQELEKLRQQVLLQEEALQTMLENEGDHPRRELAHSERGRRQAAGGQGDDDEEVKKLPTLDASSDCHFSKCQSLGSDRTCTGVSILALHAQIGLYEEERVKLYQKLDEKDDEIQKVSQELEKLRQQVLLQEEALQTMLENEEIIREENSRIQKEADDKQQEGKEMMTKKSRNFPLLMQAVTATFRSTCTGVSILALYAQIGLYEEERVKLYQQLDEKNDEIQKVSQELEKLRQQVLLQEEALQTMLENEEIIREENSRIQKEADDKQQEGKEMMTKNKLDEKDDEIQKVSQELEKLRQQVLLQEEALQTMLENEEIIREENSRIQKEADDKQQEGKEMMTKKSRNFPLLMQAVTATFRSKLDEKDDEIQKVSQELEKLRQQVLLQEEALQTMLENEEIIREENSRIQKEADDKQQEGKEMMTKKSRNFPLLMQAVTATFRSTCTGVSILALHAQIGLYEEERVKLYQKLDEKNDEIQKVSQELEKLRQQVLLQEEALQTMLENEGDHPRRELAHSERGRRQAAGGQGDDDEEVKKLPTLDASSDCHFSKCQSLGSDRTCTGVSILALHAQIGLYEEERVKLYQQLDEKNDEIQKVSQELEKLRQQVLLQEEALQTMLENEETIREENSRIQKEADDKQQEGKEMMTKKSRNFPLLMQAVTATFRSTCTGVSILALHAQIGLYEEERVKLYQQLDEKNDEIQKVSQELEKLRQQVLLQEEALQTMLENEGDHPRRELAHSERGRRQAAGGQGDDDEEVKKLPTLDASSDCHFSKCQSLGSDRTCTGVSILALHAQIGLYEEERVKLYQQLDEKNDEIQKVSQELEKLRQQVLLQEEALQTMLENEGDHPRRELAHSERGRRQAAGGQGDDDEEVKKLPTLDASSDCHFSKCQSLGSDRTCTGVSILALHAQIGLYEEERVKLYQQLDEKNDEIQKVSQELEKLRQQVLLQEEALQTMLENEETIREENSRIQKEADDKQQEGKEMMTKKSRNFPLLMQAVTATFRSTCTGVSILALHAQIGLYEEERVKLYQQLDEKNDEIQKVSQELEKLRQQVLLQEEALQTMLENEEIIREENSRIQKEADDKQQEGKEMMTKKSRNFPLLMQAVTATFRSTCTGVSILALYAQISLYEEERVKLYQKLDEKDDEIQKVSQELEKLRQQVLLQEEALQTMLENEEIIREENSRIQKEADDKQQEGKEMMTKKSRNFPLLMQAVTATFRSTCTGVSILALYAQIGLYEEERVKLYQQLDEKNDEIQKVSQELEKLRQQVLLQEEALQTMLENEEIIREENSRIQKEADDKQQEGKEMMTKKSRNFPLLMQAVTATFRSTCTGVSILALYAQIGLYEEERVKLYQQLDEKNDEIQKVSQELEKLRQQVLLQEEALQTMLENEEIIREENSRIQKEADDKQQEGKEMMTKKSRNFPLLMQAVTATFRSTCTGVSILALYAQIGLYEEERVKLYQQLDEKNDEIQKVSQELEKLRQQVLLQEEALQTMLENEEIIREENSRIQKEADDKQQEGKEMMTKKSRNFPLLMQAVTATFRSTCTGVSILALYAQIGLYEEERVKLYQKLDEKDDEIQKVSQELEKLRQQVLLQEEALQTMLENEETIREENSRIQKEADDKQQEGKEMMTKKSRNFPLLMLATCTGVSILALYAQIGLYEEERVKLYQKLDEKDDEIQNVSQELEKLRQQVLLQEEALQTMLENEETIREENSRIQKEADDKQQEGKEMMTKKSRNFPLLMQAVTATFRSTCTGVSILALHAQIGLYEEERVKLYQKLDEKNDEIQKVSQELEKLRQQVLLQEEALQTMLENEEIIREENSRIQKEADDKQQEGKEMMTKNRAKNRSDRVGGRRIPPSTLRAQKLDEKDDEIQKVSQELEKLRQQVLLQEEALQTMLENEEIIREENSRIQKEADDKQQEGKEMMTKKSRNFPLLMLAVTATFRSVSH
ncbi:unnamed protein product [Caenorhabditis sp. 36 PRJEB53466]|nr:unnamed protein product [Caenorhabditis sp. 36 PRJEB53466]